MGLGIVRLQLQRPAVAGDRFVQLARLVGDHAQKMDRIGMIGFDLQNLPIDLLGSLQPTGLMVLDRDRQCFGNRCHDTNYSPCRAFCQPQLWLSREGIVGVSMIEPFVLR